MSPFLRSQIIVPLVFGLAAGCGGPAQVSPDAGADVFPKRLQWTEAVHLDAPVNTTGSEKSPGVSPDGTELYFMHEGGAANDIFVVEREGASWSAATNGGKVAAVNLPGLSDEISPFVSRDGLALYFSSNRSGGFDLYYSTNNAGF